MTVYLLLNNAADKKKRGLPMADPVKKSDGLTEKRASAGLARRSFFLS